MTWDARWAGVTEPNCDGVCRGRGRWRSEQLHGFVSHRAKPRRLLVGAALVQFGLLAWNDDTPYDDLSVGYASLKIEFLER